MAVLRLSLLGGFSARGTNGQVVPLPTRKAEALLAFLACKSGEAQPRDRLTALLWGDRSDRQARHSLSQTLFSIRHAFGGSTPLLFIDRETVAMPPDAVDLDIADFQEFVSIPNGLKAALDLYRGPFLDGFNLRESGFEEWLTQERARLHEMALGAFLALADAQVGAGDDSAAIATLGNAVRLDPLAEEAHRRLMRLQIDRGLCNDAIRQYRLLADILKRELDSSPDPSTKVLYQLAAGRSKQPPQTATPADIVGCTDGGLDAPPVPCRDESAGPRRASVAIMPFTDADAGVRNRLARSLTYDIITRLAKLRSLFVIAQGTVFALADKGMSAAEAGRALNVTYIASGTVRRQGERAVIAIELVEMRSARIVWAETFDRKLDDTLLVLDELGDRIVTAIASEIEMVERNRAILKPPSSLDAWEALHCGLWHMYRFNEADNQRARQFFETAINLDPTLARAHAGLSFTHFQNAFLLRTGDRAREIDLAYEAAGQGLIADDRDPAAHWAMGRALWLRGRQEQSLLELESAVGLSPNFALGHYSLSFVHCQSGNPCSAIGFSDHSRHLSPFDPMLFAMLAARALAHARLGQFGEAADWGLKAAARPNAHAHIQAIAAQCLALADRVDEARALVPRIHRMRPGYSLANFIEAFQFGPGDAALFRKAAKLNRLA
jgi:TolB-like protein/DNA-binding SARP family transcriptional activator